MKLTRLAAIAAPAVAGLAAAGGLATTSLTANAAPAAHAKPAATPKIAVYDCANRPSVRPSEFDMTCDGSAALTKMHWSDWNTTEATGTGVFWVNNCTPNCAQGHWSHSNVIVVLWRAEPVAHHRGDYAYSKMTLLTPSNGRTVTLTPPGAF
jgi:hypothetical protein